MPLPVKVVRSQRVAAKLVLARSGSMPTHGPRTEATGGRSTTERKPGGVPMSRGAVAFERARPAQAAAPSEPQRALTAAERPVCVDLSLAGRAVLRTTVVTTRLPVRATPTVIVAGCLPHDRSRKARASSPTRLTVHVSMSCVRGSAQPAYQTEAVLKLVAAWSASRDI